MGQPLPAIRMKNAATIHRKLEHVDKMAVTLAACRIFSWNGRLPKFYAFTGLSR